MSKDAHQEKTAAALSSVVAAVGLTAFKVVVGVTTNSLGILAEAAHSALDLAAALMTLFAVRVADKPADREHHFGHGKVESVSALFETLLLLATSVWIIFEASRRLRIPETHVDVSVWAFVVMGTSIVVDVSRSRMLKAAAVKHRSQALEADALHFSTDVWSSSVVIVGLVFVLVASRFPSLVWLEKADSIAALAVAVIVAHISAEMGWRAIRALLDAAPMSGEYERVVAEVGAMPGISGVHHLRIRSAGAGWFVDMHVTMDGALSLAESHAATEQVEELVHGILPTSDVTVHVEPHTVRQETEKPTQEHLGRPTASIGCEEQDGGADETRTRDLRRDRPAF